MGDWVLALVVVLIGAVILWSTLHVLRAEWIGFRWALSAARPERRRPALVAGAFTSVALIAATVVVIAEPFGRYTFLYVGLVLGGLGFLAMAIATAGILVGEVRRRRRRAKREQRLG